MSIEAGPDVLRRVGLNGPIFPGAWAMAQPARATYAVNAAATPQPEHPTMRPTPQPDPGLSPQVAAHDTGKLADADRDTPATGLAAHAAAPAAPRCPSCRSRLLRTWRLPSDRILNFFVALYRYRCHAHHCRWEGNICKSRAWPFHAHNDQYPLDREAGRTVPRTFVACMQLSVAAAAVVFVAAHTDWMPSESMAISQAGSEPASVSAVAGITPVASKGR